MTNKILIVFQVGNLKDSIATNSSTSDTHGTKPRKSAEGEPIPVVTTAHFNGAMKQYAAITEYIALNV